MKINWFTILATMTVLYFSSAVNAHNKVVVIPLGGSDYKHESPLIVPAAEFQNDGVFPEKVVHRRLEGSVGGSDSGGTGCAVAPVYLPNGATITAFVATVVDNSIVPMSISLMRTPVHALSGPAGEIAGMGIIGRMSPDLYDFGTNQISEPVVNNKDFAYSAIICFLGGANTKLFSTRVLFDE